jgi:predicted dehydrogenase
MVRQGHIGQLERVEVILNKNETGGPFRALEPPRHLNWDLWQGQTPAVPYIPERCHYTFRWWYEYSGGEMTDWGAHHVDIAQWAIGEFPKEVDTTATLPEVKDGFNVATSFSATYRYPSGVVMTVSDTGRNGILFSGSEGRIFVNRGTLSGKPVEVLARNPLPRERFRLYEHDDLALPPRMGKLDAIATHMANFFDCVERRYQPISDIESQHRSVTTCHLANISMWLGRPLKWDAATEQFVGDADANQRLRRQQRAGFEVA